MSDAAPATATASASATTAASAPAPAPAPSWTAGFDEATRGVAELKGWKGPADAISAYTNLEKTVGVPPERLLTLPKDKTDAAAWNKIHERLGRPADPTGYKIDFGQGHDPDFAKWATGVFHKTNLSQEAAAGLTAEWNSYMRVQSAKMQTEYKAEIAKQEASLKTDWGNAYDRNIAVAKHTTRALGLTPEIVDKLEQGMGFAGLMKFVHTIGTKIGEDRFVAADDSRPGFGSLTPAAAKAQIQSLKGDTEFVKKWLAGDTKSKAEMDRLHRQAYPGA